MTTHDFNVPILTFRTARETLEDAILAGVNVLLVGPPGCGKTTLASEIAQGLTHDDGTTWDFDAIIAATLDPTDPGGMPVVQRDQTFVRIPMRTLRNAAEKPHVLLWDEITTAPEAVEGALLRIFCGNWAGDTKLHDRTVHIACCNPPEQTASGRELGAALRGRFAMFQFRPTISPTRDDPGEIFAWFRDVLGGAPGPTGALARDFAATLAVKPDLIQLDPPEGAIVGSQKFASPRDWTRAIQLGARGADDRDRLFRAIAGCVGDAAAVAYLAIRDLRRHLPTADAVTRDPAGALCPADIDVQIGALGLLAEVADRDVWAAWVYATRLDDEIALAAAQALMIRNTANAPTAHANTGKAARVKLLGRIGNAVRGAL